MKVLVIGGSGLFGRKITLHLLRDQSVSSVVNMDVDPPPGWWYKSAGPLTAKFCYLKGDVSNLEEILDLISSHYINRIVNMAAVLTGAWELNPRRAVKVNCLGMCNVFEAARLSGIKRVVYASSVGVYGPASEYGFREVTEEDRPHPDGGYGLTKELAEIVAARYQDLYDIQSTGLRPFLGYGYGGAFPPVIKLFSDLVSLPAVGKPFSTEGDGSGEAALSSADDVAALTRILVKAPSSPHPVYNVASQPTSMLQIAAVVLKYLPEAGIQFSPAAPRNENQASGLPAKASMARAKEDLGFEIMPLDQSVKIHINDARLDAGLPLLA